MKEINEVKHLISSSIFEYCHTEKIKDFGTVKTKIITDLFKGIAEQYFLEIKEMECTGIDQDIVFYLFAEIKGNNAEEHCQNFVHKFEYELDKLYNNEINKRILQRFKRDY